MEKSGALFPAPAPGSVMPAGYAALLSEIKERIRTSRLRTILAGNAAMTLLYWDIGRSILLKQKREGWGAKVIDRLSADLAAEFPAMKGFSPRNLKYMRAFAAAWPERAIVQGPLAQISWYCNIALLSGVMAEPERLWYARKAFENGWSQSVLCFQIESRAYERAGKTVNNFSAALPPADSDLAGQVFKDPYLFDFLGTGEQRREKEMEAGLVAHIQKFLLELGQGFAFVGRQVHLELGGSDFYIDLLFYHLKLRRYVVIELKAGKLEPGHVSQLNMYMSAVDDLLRHKDDAQTIGLLLVKQKDRLLAEYSLRGFSKPMGIAQWQTQLTRTLPAGLKSSLPEIAEIEAELKEK